jgi:hypothetical protein
MSLPGLAGALLGGVQAVASTDQVAQESKVTRLRIIRVKHFQAATGDEIASLVGAWFRAKKETTYTNDGEFVSEKVLSEQRELLDWRYQVTGSGVEVSTATAVDPTTDTTIGLEVTPEAASSTGELHHIMLFYAE